MQWQAIDLFAGAGGFTQGATQAGIEVVWAANHWQTAVSTHAKNHAETEHVCQDLHQANWAKVPYTNLILASPCCQGHSRARGKHHGNPQHDDSRSTAWAVTSAVEYHKPEAFIVENVPEFLNWQLYPAWAMAMQCLGYQLTTQVIDAADCGVAQNRERLFVVGARCAEIHVEAPGATHEAIEPIIDWSHPRWSVLADKVPATRKRAAAGTAAHGARFVMPYYGNARGGRALDRPVGTITCTDRWAVVDGDRVRMFTVDEYRQAMGFPADYELGGTSKKERVKLLGNAVCPPVAEHVVRSVTSQVEAKAGRLL